MDIWFSFLYIYIDKCMLGSDFSKHFVEIMNVYIAIYSFFCLNIVSDVKLTHTVMKGYFSVISSS